MKTAQLYKITTGGGKNSSLLVNMYNTSERDEHVT